MRLLVLALAERCFDQREDKCIRDYVFYETGNHFIYSLHSIPINGFWLNAYSVHHPLQVPDLVSTKNVYTCKKIFHVLKCDLPFCLFFFVLFCKYFIISRRASCRPLLDLQMSLWMNWYAGVPACISTSFINGWHVGPFKGGSGFKRKMEGTIIAYIEHDS